MTGQRVRFSLQQSNIRRALDRRQARRARPCLRSRGWGSARQAARRATWLSTTPVKRMHQSASATRMLFLTCNRRLLPYQIVASSLCHGSEGLGVSLTAKQASCC